MQKHAHEDDDTFLPEAAYGIKFVRDLRPGGRAPELRRCEECGGLYVLIVTYEYYADGSEDEQTLIRVASEEEAEKYAER